MQQWCSEHYILTFFLAVATLEMISGIFGSLAVMVRGYNPYEDKD